MDHTDLQKGVREREDQRDESLSGLGHIGPYPEKMLGSGVERLGLYRLWLCPLYICALRGRLSNLP